jgi:hypothetical protein
MKNDVFWDLTPCCSSKKNRHFGGTCRLHLQGNELAVSVCLTTDDEECIDDDDDDDETLFAVRREAYPRCELGNLEARYREDGDMSLQNVDSSY